MIRDISGSTGQQTSQECNIVYEYLRQQAAIQSPPELIQEFQKLLQQGRNEDSKVSQALDKIIFSLKPQFEVFLSHCFYVILDCWLDNAPESMLYLDQLFNTLDFLSKTRSYDRRRKRLVQLIKDYQQTESYLQLKAVITIIHPQGVGDADENSVITNEESERNNDYSNTIINNYLVRYTYLYQYFFPANGQFSHLISLSEKLRDKRQRDFEILLSKHIIYRFRLKQLAKMKLLTKGAGKIITKVDSPSLLSEKAFRLALKQYTGKLDHQATVLERSHHLITKNELHHSYQEFKGDLYRFIVNDVQPRNNNCNFKIKFQQKLGSIFPQSDGKSLNRTLVLQTCRQLFSFLIVDPALSSNPQRFADLIANLGTAQVMMILVKITLICPEAKPDLEKKLCSLVAHYQLQKVEEAPWLVKSLEHLLVAFSIYFGNLDVSFPR